jgi:competence protein ComEC
MSDKRIDLLVLLLTSVLFSGELTIYQIDVNQGDAALIISPTNKYVLIDAGDDRRSYGDTVLNFLRSLGITHLDHILVSHYHQDHIGGIPRVIYGLSGPESNDSLLGWCYDRGDTYTTPTFINYRNAVGNKRRTVNLGETLDLGGSAYIYCLAKNGRLINGDSVLHNTGENYRSLVWVLEYGRFRFYTGGDLVGYNVSGERDVESKVAKIIRPVDVIKVNHHGSRNSSNNEFLDSLRPQVAIISQGVDPANNGHPHQEALTRLVNRNIYIYQLNDNPSGGTIPQGRGRILNTTASLRVNNAIFSVNGDTYLIRGVTRDGGCLNIINPQDTILEGTIVYPQAIIVNYSNVVENFRVRFKIGDDYDQTHILNNLGINETSTITFDNAWYAMRGIYPLSCSLEVFGDTNPYNDKQTSSVTVAFHDNSINEIINPANNSVFYLGNTLVPQIIVADNSYFTYPESVWVYTIIHKNGMVIYTDSVKYLSIPHHVESIYFQPVVLNDLDEGTYVCSVWVTRRVDQIVNNNYIRTEFTILSPNSIKEKTNSVQNSEPLAINIYNSLGSLVRRITTVEKNYSNIYKILKTLKLRTGIYFVTPVSKNNQKSNAKKLVVYQ